MSVLGGELDERYEVLEKVRVGGMGAIYKVRHRLLDEVRVIKTLRRPTASGEAAERFLAEAKAATRLRHPNVANVYDFALGVEGHAYIIMEYIEGWNLQEVVRGYGPPPMPLTIEIAHQALRAIAYLHRLKIIHRDISPDNLMLTRDVDGKPLVKLIDLGIAKTLEEDPNKRVGTGVFVGKPRYGSPERFDGGSSDFRSDLYSFGVVLYELLTGLCPIAGNQTAAYIAGHLFLPPRSFDETDPDGRVPDDLRALVLQALAKVPEDRMPSAEDFLWHLTIIQDRFPLTAETGSELWHLRRPARPAARIELSPTPTSIAAAMKTPLAIPPSMQRELSARAAPPQKKEDAEAEEETQRLGAPGDNATTVRLGPPLRQPLRTDDTGELPTPPDPFPILLSSAAAEPHDSWALLPLQAAGRPDSENRQPPPPAADSARPPPPEPFRWLRGPLAAGVVASALLLAGLYLAPRPPWLTRLAATSLGPTSEIPPPALPATAGTPGPAGAGTNPVPRRPMRAGDLILPGDPGVQEPRVLVFPPYSFPRAARGSGRHATVRIEVLVDEHGRVIDTRLRGGDRSGLGFEEAAQVAARKAKFLPPTRDAIPGRMWTELRFAFGE